MARKAVSTERRKINNILFCLFVLGVYGPLIAMAVYKVWQYW
jgi:hypothetical protein